MSPTFINPASGDNHDGLQRRAFLNRNMTDETCMAVKLARKQDRVNADADRNAFHLYDYWDDDEWPC